MQPVNIFKDLNINPNKIQIDSLLYYHSGNADVLTFTEAEELTRFTSRNTIADNVKIIKRGVYELDSVNSDDNLLRYCLLKDQISCVIIYVHKEQLFKKINEGYIVPA